MKKLTYIFLLASCLLLASCESWLDEDPQYTLNTQIQFSTSEKARTALYGCYAYLALTSGGYGQHWQEIPVRYSGLGWAQTNGNTNDMCGWLQCDYTDDLLTTAWLGMYKVINETNAFIANVENTSLEGKDEMAAEARFLRALSYYNLTICWGDIPLKTTPSSHDGVAVVRSPRSQVLDVVRTDLEFAAKYLPETNSDGFPTKWAAEAYLGKLYHTLGCLGDATAWEKAKTYFEGVKGKYDLESKFSNLFVDKIKGSKESIFQLGFQVNGDLPSFNRGSWLFNPAASSYGKSFHRVKCTKAFYDFFAGTYLGDPRLETTFMAKWRKCTNNVGPVAQVEPVPSARDSTYEYPYFTYDSGVKPAGWKNNKLLVGRIPYELLTNKENPSADEILAITNDETKFDEKYRKGLKDYLNVCTAAGRTGERTAWPHFAKTFDMNMAGIASHKNLILYRYADLLLMLADVYNELDRKDDAINTVDLVLARARKSGTKASAQPAKWESTLTKDQVREKIFFERLFEGAGETEMYQMMRLRGIEYLKKALAVNNNHSITKKWQENNPNATGVWGERIYNNGDLNDETFLKKNLLFPIPRDEMNTNTAITENNFGY